VVVVVGAVVVVVVGLLAQEATPSVPSVCAQESEGPEQVTVAESPGLRFTVELTANAPEATMAKAPATAPDSTAAAMVRFLVICPGPFEGDGTGEQYSTVRRPELAARSGFRR
jgi:hypothetical protein